MRLRTARGLVPSIPASRSVTLRSAVAPLSSALLNIRVLLSRPLHATGSRWFRILRRLSRLGSHPLDVHYLGQGPQPGVKPRTLRSIWDRNGPNCGSSAAGSRRAGSVLLRPLLARPRRVRPLTCPSTSLTRSGPRRSGSEATLRGHDGIRCHPGRAVPYLGGLHGRSRLRKAAITSSAKRRTGSRSAASRTLRMAY